MENKKNCAALRFDETASITFSLGTTVQHCGMCCFLNIFKDYQHVDETADLGVSP